MPSVVRIAISDASDEQAEHHPLDPGAGAEIDLDPAQREERPDQSDQNGDPAADRGIARTGLGIDRGERGRIRG